MSHLPKILIIDDDRDMGELICATAEVMGFDCTATTRPSDFLEALTPETDLIFLDLMMPEMDGVELLRLLGQRRCTVGIVLISGIGRRVMETAQGARARPRSFDHRSPAKAVSYRRPGRGAPSAFRSCGVAQGAFWIQTGRRRR